MFQLPPPRQHPAANETSLAVIASPSNATSPPNTSSVISASHANRNSMPSSSQLSQQHPQISVKMPTQHGGGTSISSFSSKTTSTPLGASSVSSTALGPALLVQSSGHAGGSVSSAAFQNDTPQFLYHGQPHTGCSGLLPSPNHFVGTPKMSQAFFIDGGLSTQISNQSSTSSSGGAVGPCSISGSNQYLCGSTNQMLGGLVKQQPSSQTQQILAVPGANSTNNYNLAPMGTNLLPHQQSNSSSSSQSMSSIHSTPQSHQHQRSSAADKSLHRQSQPQLSHASRVPSVRGGNQQQQQAIVLSATDHPLVTGTTSSSAALMSATATVAVFNSTEQQQPADIYGSGVNNQLNSSNYYLAQGAPLSTAASYSIDPSSATALYLLEASGPSSSLSLKSPTLTHGHQTSSLSAAAASATK